MKRGRTKQAEPSLCSTTCICLALFAFVASYNFTSIIFFHSSKHSVSDSAWSYNSRSSYGYSGYSRRETFDDSRVPWKAISDVKDIRCTNIEALRIFGNRQLSLTAAEEGLYGKLNCSVRLGLMHDAVIGGVLSQSSNARECVHMKDSLHIVPKENWGDADQASKRAWERNRCDCYFDKGCVMGNFMRKAPSLHESTSASGITGAVRARAGDERLRKLAKGEVIAIVLGATSKNVRFEMVEKNPLFEHLLPSVRATATPGFEYWVCVGYDAGDLYYDDASTLEELRNQFEKRVSGPLRSEGVLARVVFMRFANLLRKPGPIFNFVAAAAFVDGADYVFRVNDDTQILTKGWSQLLVDKLKGLSPPYVGVVGPVGKEDASASRMMITHDFVHRTHMRIFETYYPPVLSDWWMDDWISHVYPEGKAFKMLTVKVSHHMETIASVHRTSPGDPVRYSVDFDHQKFLGREVDDGLTRIEDFVARCCPGQGECYGGLDQGDVCWAYPPLRPKDATTQ